MNYYQNKTSKQMQTQSTIMQHENMMMGAVPSDAGGVPADFEFLYFPKSDKKKFGTFHTIPKGFDMKSPVFGIVVLLGFGDPTTGDGSQAALEKMSHWAGIYNASNPNVPCLLSSVNRKNVVLVFVQTTIQSAYLNGEIQMAFDEVRGYNLKQLPGLLTCSGGGYGSLQWINTDERAKMFPNAVFISPGGNGNVGKQFPALAAAAKMNCQFYHNSTDPIANVKQSQLMNDGIIAAGGNSVFVEWDNAMNQQGKPVHDVTTPLNAYYPWAAWNDTDKKLMPGSYVPTASIYDFLCKGGTPIPPPIMLLCATTVYHGSDTITCILYTNSEGGYDTKVLVNQEIVEFGKQII